jgi:hypothetical protein
VPSGSGGSARAAGAGDDAREHLARDPEPLEQRRRPVEGADVEQLGPRGVAGLDDVLAAEAGQQERVDGPQAHALAAVGVEEPAGLRGAEHGVEREAADRADLVRVLAQRAGVRALVLPAEHGAERLARSAVPQQQRLALRAQADGGDRPAVAEALRHGGLHAGPDLLGVLLDPARPRRREADRRGAAGDDLAGGVHEHRLGGARALVDRQDVLR